MRRKICVCKPLSDSEKRREPCCSLTFSNLGAAVAAAISNAMNQRKPRCPIYILQIGQQNLSYPHIFQNQEVILCCRVFFSSSFLFFPMKTELGHGWQADRRKALRAIFLFKSINAESKQKHYKQWVYCPSTHLSSVYWDSMQPNVSVFCKWQCSIFSPLVFVKLKHISRCYVRWIYHLQNVVFCTAKSWENIDLHFTNRKLFLF